MSMFTSPLLPKWKWVSGCKEKGKRQHLWAERNKPTKKGCSFWRSMESKISIKKEMRRIPGRASLGRMVGLLLLLLGARVLFWAFEFERQVEQAKLLHSLHVLFDPLVPSLLVNWRVIFSFGLFFTLGVATINIILGKRTRRRGFFFFFFFFFPFLSASDHGRSGMFCVFGLGLYLFGVLGRWNGGSPKPRKYSNTKFISFGLSFNQKIIVFMWRVWWKPHSALVD